MKAIIEKRAYADGCKKIVETRVMGLPLFKKETEFTRDQNPTIVSALERALKTAHSISNEPLS